MSETLTTGAPIDDLDAPDLDFDLPRGLKATWALLCQAPAKRRSDR